MNPPKFFMQADDNAGVVLFIPSGLCAPGRFEASREIACQTGMQSSYGWNRLEHAS
jgi:hypothetical protein